MNKGNSNIVDSEQTKNGDLSNEIVEQVNTV